MSEVDIIDDAELMPVAPATDAPQAEVDGTFDGSLLAGVANLGEAIPMGTYHFRLDGYTTGWSKPDVKYPDEARFGNQPYFMLNWSCQEEPHTGRSPGPEFCGWCSKEVFQAAAGGDRTAMRMVNSKLVVAKDVLAGADLKSAGTMDFKSFLATNPEMRLQLGLQPGKTATGKIDSKSGKKEYVADGSMRNRILKHVSLTRPK